MAKGKSKLPKTLLGVRVPKQLRRSGAVASILASPLAREILADVLVAAAGAAATALTRNRKGGADISQTGGGAAEAGGEVGGKAKDPLQSAGGTLGTVLSEVATTLLPSEKKGKHGKGRKRDKDGAPLHH
jgi:hypothetical protein